MQLIDIHYKMGAYPLFQSLNANFSSGMVGIVGANGCGKSTLLRMLSGLLAPDQGSVMLNGENIYANGKHTSTQIGYVGASSCLYNNLTVKENLFFVSQCHLIPKADFVHRCKQVLKQCDISGHEEVLYGHCSDGVKKRVMIAAALIYTPRLLILDEPCTALDPNQRAQLWHLLNHIKQESVDIIFSSHHPQECAPWCEALYHLHQGQLQ